MSRLLVKHPPQPATTFSTASRTRLRCAGPSALVGLQGPGTAVTRGYADGRAFTALATSGERGTRRGWAAALLTGRRQYRLTLPGQEHFLWLPHRSAHAAA